MSQTMRPRETATVTSTTPWRTLLVNPPRKRKTTPARPATVYGPAPWPPIRRPSGNAGAKRQRLSKPSDWPGHAVAKNAAGRAARLATGTAAGTEVRSGQQIRSAATRAAEPAEQETSTFA